MAFPDRQAVVSAAIYDEFGNAITVVESEGVFRVQIAGTVAVTNAVPPPNTDPFTVVADTPLTVGDNTVALVVPNGELLHIQSLIVGNEDPTKGAFCELIWNDGADHLISRVYTAGFTQLFGFADITEARDGTTLLGNGVNEIRVRRAKQTGTDIAIDALLRGYTTT